MEIMNGLNTKTRLAAFTPAADHKDFPFKIDF